MDKLQHNVLEVLEVVCLATLHALKSLDFFAQEFFKRLPVVPLLLVIRNGLLQDLYLVALRTCQVCVEIREKEKKNSIHFIYRVPARDLQGSWT